MKTIAIITLIVSGIIVLPVLFLFVRQVIRDIKTGFDRSKQ